MQWQTISLHGRCLVVMAGKQAMACRQMMASKQAMAGKQATASKQAIADKQAMSSKPAMAGKWEMASTRREQTRLMLSPPACVASPPANGAICRWRREAVRP